MAIKSHRLTETYFERPKKTKTWSGFSVKEVYTPEDTTATDYDEDVADPGNYPYTRGIYRDMYRGRYWTRREVCGFGTASGTAGSPVSSIHF